MSEEKHILTKLEKIYFGKKENEKLTMHEIGVVLDYVALLEQNNRYKNEEIERLYNIIKKLEEFIEREIELYTVELTEENKNKLSIVAPIKGVYKEIYNVLKELKEE